jgi:hypothetical protein
MTNLKLIDRWERFFNLSGCLVERDPVYRGWKPDLKITIGDNSWSSRSEESFFIWVEDYKTAKDFETHAVSLFNSMFYPDDPHAEFMNFPKDIPVTGAFGVGRNPSISTEVTIMDADGDGGNMCDIRDICFMGDPDQAAHEWRESRKENIWREVIRHRTIAGR